MSRQTTLRPLTDEEQEIAAQNHSLILAYMRRKGLPEDWYPVVAEGYLRAVITRDRERGAFSTAAFVYMSAAVTQECRALGTARRRSAAGDAVSLDREYLESCDLYDVIPDPDNAMGMAELCADIETVLLPRLNDRQREMLWLSVQGYTAKEIAGRLGISHQGAHKQLLRIREVARRWLG